jgi:peroxiredoxin
VALSCAALAASGCEKKSDVPTASIPAAKPSAKPADQPVPDRKQSARQPQPPESQDDLPADGAAKSAPAESKAAPGEASAEEMGQIDPAELVLPKVLLSHAETATCLVGVGQSMPEIALADLAGKQQSLDQMLGQRLTVVVFWRGSNPYSVAELADLDRDVVDRFGSRGVRVVAIDEMDKPEQVREIVQKLRLKFPVLLDADGQALAKVATRQLPRTYLLDAAGKIVWFDIEYSRSTWRDMRHAIQFLLSQE